MAASVLNCTWTVDNEAKIVKLESKYRHNNINSSETETPSPEPRLEFVQKNKSLEQFEKSYDFENLIGFLVKKYISDTNFHEDPIKISLSKFSRNYWRAFSLMRSV